jgi:RHS repeat-associated protein
MSRSGATSYYLYDAQLSTRALADAAGTVTDRYVYDAFGEPIGQSGATENPHRYSGERYDAETGFYYLRARYYDPAIDRFISRDVHPGELSQPLSLHRYLYANASPVLFGDPTGRFTLVNLVIRVNLPEFIGWTFRSFALPAAGVGMNVATVRFAKLLAEEVWSPGQRLFNETLFANLEYDLPESLVWRTLKWARQGIAVGMGSTAFNIGIPDPGFLGAWITDVPLRELANRVHEEFLILNALPPSEIPPDLLHAMLMAELKWGEFCSFTWDTPGDWMCTP